jgi:DivIVA domain-containing protein
MAEDYSSISSSRLSAADAQRASFAVVRRGFDPQEVRSFLDLVSRELDAWEVREAEMRRAVAAAEDRAKNPVIDEANLTAALGQQSGEILRTAHEEARQVLESAQAQAAELLKSAQSRITAAAIEAEQRASTRVADAEIAATNLEQESARTAERILLQARADGETLVARAREQGRKMIEQAQEARASVLADMSTRRRTMHLQIEQLRAARDEIARSVVAVRDTVDRVTAELQSSDAAARAAAEEVARRQPTAEAIQEDAEAEASLEAAALDEQTVVPDAPAPDPETEGVVEELFAKIRASAHDGEPASSPDDETPAGSFDGPDAEEVATRDGLLEAPQGALARKVKRIIQDEQNQLLDQLRAGGVTEADLEPEPDQLARYAGAAVDPLRDAANAAQDFCVQRGAPQGPGLSDGAVQVIAEELARNIVVPLRRRVIESLASPDPTVEVNGAYRELRGARIDRAVSDAAVEAFGAATVAVVGDGTVRWAAATTGEPCADCADNALEGPVRAGATFPTGQAYPPAHPGCRCAILPAG